MDTYALALGVIANLLHIEARNDFQDVRFRARRTESGSILVIPSLLGVPVDRVIIQSVTGYEINVIFIRGEIVSAKKVVSGTTFPFHHVKVVLPGLIQDVSSILQGSLRFVRILDAIKEPI